MVDSTKLPEVDINAIATDLNDKVGKNGDSVNGTYYAITNDTALVINNTNITDSTGTPTANTWSGIQFNDANGVRYGKLEGTWNVAGHIRFGFNTSRNVNGSNVYAQVTAWVDANGNTFFNFPKCTTKPTTTSSASADKVAVVTQNYRNGNSWYRVYSDGWCEQGGTTKAENQTVTFLKAFTSTPTMSWGFITTRGAASYDGEIFFRSVTTTKFVTGSRLDDAISPGFMWRACGWIN